MIEYQVALESFPSDDLVKRMLIPSGESRPDVIKSAKVLLQMALFGRLAESNLDTRIEFVKKGQCILLPFRDITTGSLMSITFDANQKESIALNHDLARELHALASKGIDVDGLGVVKVDGDSVAYIPHEDTPEPTYGNILIFDPYRRVKRE